MKDLLIKLLDLFYALITLERENYFRSSFFAISVVGLFWWWFNVFTFRPDFFTPSWNLIAALAPIYVPLILLRVFWKLWFDYIRSDFIKKQGSVLLEIKIPKETNKSPLAMEIFLTSLFQTGSSSYVDTFWKGKVRPWFSLELVSLGGEVHFFIWSQLKWRNILEAQIYAQYPNIEIYEVPDYAATIPYDISRYPFWATHFKLTKDDVFPIKTYVDYGLDKDPKEEFKIDPITSVLEYLGSLKKGQMAWIQILIQAHRKSTFTDDAAFGVGRDWVKEAKAKIEEIRDEATPDRGPDVAAFPNPTKGQIEQIASIERSLGKFPFDTMMRGMFFWDPKEFDAGGISGLIGSVRQYSSNFFNGFKLGKFTDYDYFWLDFGRHRRNRLERHYLDAYRRRSFFQTPYQNYRNRPFILTTEELATIYHFPGGVAATPTFSRILSKKSEPPGNLPI